MKLNLIDMLPSSFDYTCYVNHENNIDLKEFSVDAARQHYESFGRDEGRICSKIINRQSFINIIPDNLPILEIGPFFSPAFNTKKSNVYYVDCFSREEMIARSLSIEGANIENIPNIDYVWKGEPYSELISRKFSFIYSAHNIEHQCCLINHIHDIESVLEENGMVFFVIPDKRYCFDHFFPETTLTDIIDAWLNKLKKHRYKDILDHHFYTTHNDVLLHWQGEHDVNKNILPMDESERHSFLSEIEKINTTDQYIDVHAWKFTPQTFATIIENLFNLNLISLRIARIYPTIKNSNEFYVILIKG